MTSAAQALYDATLEGLNRLGRVDDLDLVALAEWASLAASRQEAQRRLDEGIPRYYASDDGKRPVPSPEQKLLLDTASQFLALTRALGLSPGHRAAVHRLAGSRGTVTADDDEFVRLLKDVG